ncbi:hypothetical protein Tco_1238360, partial [Tanacetum coccineum]
MRGGWITVDGTRAVLSELEMCTWSIIGSGSHFNSLEEEEGEGGGTEGHAKVYHSVHRIHANAARFHRPKGSTSSHQPAMKGKIRDSSIGIIRTMGHRRLCSWFSQLIQASSEFITDERVTMVEIEGIPLKVWNENTFIRIASKWGTLLNVENLEKENYHCKRLCVLTKSMSHIFESFKINYKGKTHWVRAIEIPGWTPDLDDQNDEESDSEDEECEEVFKKDFGESDEEVQGENDVSRVSDTEVEEENPKSKDGVVSMFYTRAKCAENVEMDNQKDNCDGEFGNVNNISDEVNFSSGFNTYKKAGGESMDSDHCRESEGSRKGGSILMLMDELVKVGQTMGYNMDGCMKNIEEIIESQGVDGCFGSVIIMGDFNEVRNKNKRFGTIFNVHGANAFNSFISMTNLEEVPLGGCSFTMGVTIASKMIEISKKEDTCLEWHETKSENSKTCAETESSLNLEMIMTNEMRHRVVQAVNRIGCGVLKAPFAYLGGRLTLLKAVLGSMPIYHMSIFKVPMKVLQRMESIRSRFFSGVDLNSKKSIWVKWSKVLCSKEKGGLGLIKAIHGEDGKNGSGFKKKLGNGADTYFWEDLWHGDMVLKQRIARLYALEVKKTVDVASKLSQGTWTSAVSYALKQNNQIRVALIKHLEKCSEVTHLAIAKDVLLLFGPGFFRWKLWCWEVEDEDVHSYGTVDYEKKPGTSVTWKAIYKRISLMGDPEKGATQVLNQWENEGKKVTKWELCRIVKEMRKYGRHKLALE